MRQFKYYQAYFCSFFSAKLYRDVCQNWKGLGFAYIFSLLLWLAIPVTFSFFFLSLKYIYDFQQVLHKVHQIPVAGEQIQFQQPMPFYIYDQYDSKDLIAVIDTTDKTTLEQISKTRFLIRSSDVLIHQPNSHNVLTLPASALGNVVINEQNFISLIAAYVGLGVLGFYVIFLIISFLYRILQMLIYSALGYLFFKRKRWHQGLEYGAVLRLSAVAITPAVVMSCIFEAINLYTNQFRGAALWLLLFYFFLSMAYLFFAFHVNRSEQLDQKNQDAT